MHQTPYRLPEHGLPGFATARSGIVSLLVLTAVLVGAVIGLLTTMGCGGSIDHTIDGDPPPAIPDGGVGDGAVGVGGGNRRTERLEVEP